ncbi:MAG: hypothetical protein COA86_05615 [Kangiella sp.]|nr:MAG: hypothetical protein COB38_08730 [Gammaproteobacteria bacterium]PHS19142.1 MAG: hypothetical protein COA86_05615 [Kangiella sp.]
MVNEAAQVKPFNQMTQEEVEKEFKIWSQKEYVKISKFCNSKGHQVTGVDQSRCQSLPPVLGLWFVKTRDKKVDLWCIAGEFPTDLANSKVAENAREALRYFSMSWQLQSAKLEEGLAEGKISLQDKETQEKFIKELTTRAESLYELYSNDKIWKNSGL